MANFLETLANVFDPQGDAPPAPSWEGRLKQAKYQSPSGIVVAFDFEDLEGTFPKKTSAFESAAGDGTYIQDNGLSSGRFPLNVIFHGDDYDERANTFLKALLEKGEGILSHPVYGEIDCVPFGDITRQDALKTAANQAIFSVEFYETTGLSLGQLGNFQQVFEVYQDLAAGNFAEKLNVSDIANRETFKSKFQRTLKTVERGLTNATRIVEGASKSTEAVSESINRSLDVLVNQPLTLARQTQILMGEPARIVGATRERLRAYGNLARDIFGGGTAAPDSFDFENSNGFQSDLLFAGSLVANAGITAQLATFDTKPQYLSTAQQLGELADEMILWQDANGASLSQTDTIQGETTDTGAGWSELVSLLSLIIGNLVARSFDAKTEYRVELSEDRSPIDLCFELYGTASPEQLDIFQQQNDLSGDEYFLIKRGRSIVWYL